MTWFAGMAICAALLWRLVVADVYRRITFPSSEFDRIVALVDSYHAYLDGQQPKLAYELLTHRSKQQWDYPLFASQNKPDGMKHLYKPYKLQPLRDGRVEYWVWIYEDSLGYIYLLEQESAGWRICGPGNVFVGSNF